MTTLLSWLVSDLWHSFLSLFFYRRDTDLVSDESMQPWHSPDFRRDSLISQSEWIHHIFDTRGIEVYIMHSWTKLWSCTGLRLGSVVCPTASHCTKLKKVQVPWSVNLPALKFLEVVTSEQEQDYLDETWAVTTEWRANLVDRLEKLGGALGWEIHGKPFLSWVWIDMCDARVADQAVALAKRAGVPVRAGLHGYGCDTCVRAAVRNPEQVNVLIGAWESLPRYQQGLDKQ